jgi:hypothetical protein
MCCTVPVSRQRKRNHLGNLDIETLNGMEKSGEPELFMFIMK